MTIIVSGATFNYRENLRDLGGKYDGDARRWMFPDTLSERHISTIRRMVGVVITIPQAAKETAEQFVNRVSAEPERFTSNSDTNIYGDDEEYFNYFAQQNPLSFFGFSSLGAMADYIEAIPSSVSNEHSSNRNKAWRLGSDFTETNNMREAIKSARNGWTDGNELAKEVLELLDAEHATAKRRHYDVVGSRASVGRLLANDPRHMSRRSKKPGKKVITLFVETSMSGGIDPLYAILRAACIAAMVDILEIQEFSCEILSIGTTNVSATKCGLYQTVVRLKNVGEALNLNDLVFAFGHPSFNRRFRFALCAVNDRCRSSWGGMGMPAEAFTRSHRTKANEYYIPRLTIETQALVRGSTLREKALSLLPHLIPDGLPINLEK